MRYRIKTYIPEKVKVSLRFKQIALLINKHVYLQVEIEYEKFRKKE